MKVYILRAGYEYCESKIINVFDSVNKAKGFCTIEYGIRLDDWTYSEKDKYYFYDALEKRELKTDYTEFTITVKTVL